LVAEHLTIADIAWFPWVYSLGDPKSYNAAEILHLNEFGNVNRWLQRIHSRPAVLAGMKINTKEQPEKH
jgi:glutathione S-transferase